MKKNKVGNLFYLIIIFWPLIFVINEIIKFPTVLLTLVLTLVSFIYLYNINKKKAVVFMSIVLIIFGIQNIIVISNLNFNNNFVDIGNLWKFNIRWIGMITYLYILSQKRILRILKKYYSFNRKYIFNAALLVIALEVISIFFKFSYEKVWDGIYFKSIMYSPHVNSYFLIAVSIYFMLLYIDNYKKNFSLSLVIVSNILNLLTGARTSAVISLGILFIFLIAFLKFTKKIVYIILAVILIILILAFFRIIELTNIPLIEKCINVLNNPSGILNGRNYIWSNMSNYIIEHFKLINYLFGVGLAQSMNINYMYIQQQLWAHNDFIEIFIGTGIVGISVFLRILYTYVKSNREYFMFFLILIVMFFNGIFLYTELLVVIPLITILGIECKSNFNKRKVVKE